MNLFDIAEMPARAAVAQGPITLRPYQQQSLAAIEGDMDRGPGRGLLVLPTGCGKCLGRGTPVLMFDGSIKAVEDVQEGELLMGPDSEPRLVVSTCTGSEMLYRVTPTKGDPYVVNESHILSLRITGGAKLAKQYPSGAIVNLPVAEYLAQSKNFRHCAKGWRAAVDWSLQQVPLDPYILGVWLGDGTRDSFAITTPDPEVVDALWQFCEKHGLRLGYGAHSGKSRTYNVCTGQVGRGHKHWVYAALQEMGLGPAKFVPHCYKANSKHVRLEILAGLIDTDGSLTVNGYDFVSIDEQLARDVAFLCRSLGLAAYVSACRKQCVNTGAWGDYWRVSISGDVGMIPVRVARRKAGPRKQVKNVLNVGISLEPIGEGEYFGFEIEGPDRLFLLGDFTVTHNTTVFCELARRRMEQDRFLQVLLVAHQIELLEQAKARFELMIPGVRVGMESGDSKAPTSSQIVCASVQTIGRAGSQRLDWMRPGLIIVDEAHHAASATYQRVFERYGVFDEDSKPPYLLGVTATPHRMDNRALHSRDGATFERILFQYTLRQAIADQFLANVRGYRAVASALDLSVIGTQSGDYKVGELQSAMDVPEVTASGIAAWREVAEQRRTLVFCVGVEHAKHVAEAFRQLGYRADAVYGDMDRDVRERTMRRFRSGELQILTNCSLVTEGVDVPEIDAVLMLRPTQSWALYTQMAGRGLRLAGGKSDCIVIDVVGNSERHALGKTPPVSLAGVFDLPLGLDLGGELVTDAIDLLEQMDEYQRGTVMKRVIDMQGLHQALTEVDLLAELGIPDELSGVTTWSWLKLTDDQYMLACGSDRVTGARRSVSLKVDALGAWEATIVDGTQQFTRALGGALPEAMRATEKVVRSRWPEVGLLVDTKSAWRSQRPTDKQIEMLRRIGIESGRIAAINKGQATAILTRHFATRKGKKR